MPPLEQISRRELNKAATREAIVKAALTLAQEKGLGGFTVEELAEAAGISRRTFFNYFGSAEEAVAAPTYDVLDQILRRFDDRPSDEPLLESAVHALSGPSDASLLEPLARTFAIAQGHHQATRLQLEAFENCGERIVRVVRERDPGPMDELYLRTIVGCVMACGKAALEHWYEQTLGDLSPGSLDELRRHLVNALAHLRTGFGQRLST